MRTMSILLFISILLVGCAPNPSIDHMACQEGGIKDEMCTLAENSNVRLFGRDLAPYVDYEEVAQGFLARPKEPGDYPGVVMIHEWWGLNDNIKEMAKILAKEGYVVLAVDMYGGQVATTSAKARELATAVRSNPEKAVKGLKDAVAYLRGQGVQKIASLGWCFGGQQSLQLALNEDLDATVIYYGHLIDDTKQLKVITWPVLGIFGEEDKSISVASVKSFEAALDALGIENEIYIYPGVGHAFANPSGSNYAADETIDAWEKTVMFLDGTLKGKSGKI